MYRRWLRRLQAKDPNTYKEQPCPTSASSHATSFNEGNLLKCLGKLYIETEDKGHPVKFAHDHEPFEIEQDEGSGSLEATNIRITVRGEIWRFIRPLNSRRPWPLYATKGDEEISVFTDEGQLTDEFQRLIQGKSVQPT